MKLLVLLMTFLISVTGAGQTFKNSVEKIFFPIELNKRDTSILHTFDQDTSIHFKRKVLLPNDPNSKEDNGQTFSHLFTFIDHPYFEFKIKQGSYSIVTRKNIKLEEAISIILNIHLLSEDSADSIFNKLVSELSQFKIKKTEFQKKDPRFKRVEFTDKKLNFILFLDKGVLPINEVSFVTIAIDFIN